MIRQVSMDTLHYMMLLGMATLMWSNYSSIKVLILIKQIGVKTPLYCAVVNDRNNVVKLLLQAGADPNLANISGRTPLIVASAEFCNIIAPSAETFWTSEPHKTRMPRCLMLEQTSIGKTSLEKLH